MKKSLLFIFFCCAVQCEVCVAQAGEWAWMKGDSVYNGSGIYGTMGIADSNNTPPALYEPCEWTDITGNFWFFGGAINGVSEQASSMWKFDPAINSWIWISGSLSNNQPGIYGVKGTPSANNYPGSRAWGVCTWVDHSGNFWLFGGYGCDAFNSTGPLNDLWKYNIATSEWVWESGSNLVAQSGIYGTIGVPNVNNTPSSRYECSATWVDDFGNLWLYGGGGHNDLWTFDVTIDQWTWMQGSNYTGQPPVYGTLGMPSASNTPGARNPYSKWHDNQNNFWMFGGNTSFGPANDLWKYDPSINEWTWVNGPNVAYDNGYYSPVCISSSINVPGCRYESRSSWVDDDGKFWLFGGVNYESPYTYIFNDLWFYDPLLNEWTLVSGSSNPNVDAVYGNKGIPDINNHPASNFGSISWLDHDCKPWIFGGVRTWSSEISNILWKFIPGCGACIQPLFISSGNSLCEKFCTNFIDSSTNNPTSWQWQFPGGDPSSSTDQNPANICYDVPGSYDVTLITTNANGSDTLTLFNYITVYSTPPFPTITQVGYTLTSSPSNSYQWQFNSYDIPGATNQSYNALQSGLYTVIVGDSNGCVNSISQYVLISGVAEVGDASISIYPNPSSGSFIVEWLDGQMAGEVSIDVLNMLGQIIFSSSDKISFSSFKKEIDLSNIAAGIYFIEIKGEHEFMRKKILISH